MFQTTLNPLAFWHSAPIEKNHPDITYVKTVKVDSIVLEDILSKFDSVTLLNLDIQGAELHALRGAGLELTKVKAIYTEVNFEEVYKDCALIGELDSYLAKFGFKRVITFRTKHGWGDALYLDKNTRRRFSPSIWKTRNQFRLDRFLGWGYSNLRNILANKE